MDDNFKLVCAFAVWAAVPLFLGYADSYCANEENNCDFETADSLELK